MARALISNPRILRTGNPLGLEAIKQSAPAVFAEEAHSSRGPRYAYIPTIRPLELLLSNGWGVYEVSQQRSRVVDKDPYTKHMLRVRKLSDFDRHSDYGMEGVPEVVIINAHDGTAAYRVVCGFFRFICCNGMMVGNKMGDFTVRHTVGPATSQAVLEAAERTATERFPVMLESIDEMRTVFMPKEKQYELAEKAIELRYGSTLAPFTPADLLSNVRREEDKGDTVWKVLNRIQENIMDGGWETRSMMFGRRSMVRPVERVSAVAKINGGLWDAALEMMVA